MTAIIIPGLLYNGHPVSYDDGATVTPPAPPPDTLPPDAYGFARRNMIDLKWGAIGTGNVVVHTKDYGGFGCLDAIAVRFTTPATPGAPGGLGRIAAASFVDQPVMRLSKLSAKPFDFEGAWAGSDTVGAQFSVGVTVTRNGVTYPRLECGTTYYFNICNRDKGGASTCTAGKSTNMIVELYKPAGT